MRGHQHGVKIGPLARGGERSEDLAVGVGFEVVLGFVLQIFEHEIIRQTCGYRLISLMMPLNIGFM